MDKMNDFYLKLEKYKKTKNEKDQLKQKIETIIEENLGTSSEIQDKICQLK